MSFWGLYIVARSVVPLAELASITSWDDGTANPVQYDQTGWQLVESSVSADRPDPAVMLVDLVAETGAPALAGYIMGGDCVDIYAGGPGTGTWRACLRRNAMAAYLAVEGNSLDAVFLDPVDAAKRAAAWAVEAGLTPSNTAALTELFARTDDDSVGESEFDELLFMLGLRPTTQPASAASAGHDPSSLETRLDGFIDAFVAPAMQTTGFVRAEREFRFIDDHGTAIAFGFYPFAPGFQVQAAIVHLGYWERDGGRRPPSFRTIEPYAAGWITPWSTPNQGYIWPLPATTEEASDVWDRFEPVLEDVQSSLVAMLDPFAFVDVLHDHGAGNLRRPPHSISREVPDARRELDALYATGPSFALADAMDRLVHLVQGPFEVSRLESTLVGTGIDPHWRCERDQVVAMFRKVLDEHIGPVLTERGLTATVDGYELTSDVGEKVVLTLSLSATSASDSIGIYLHTGLLVAAKEAWEKDWISRFHRDFEYDRNLWFSATPTPSGPFSGTNPSLQCLDLHPWFLTTATVVDGGRKIAEVLLAEVDRLAPYLDPDVLVRAILGDDADSPEKVALALLTAGPSGQLDDYLETLQTNPDPYLHELAHWARQQVTLTVQSAPPRTVASNQRR